MANSVDERARIYRLVAGDDRRASRFSIVGIGRLDEASSHKFGHALMAGLFIANALVPAVCEEAIRSSYLFYLGDRGSRHSGIYSEGAVFIVGELIYDASVYPLAKAELGTDLAVLLFAIAVISGAFLHAMLTLWTAHRQRYGQSVWTVFMLALIAHVAFNLIALFALGAML